jgi:glucose-1-phosphate thymidylyltransferase
MKAVILAAGYGMRLEQDLQKMKEKDNGLYLDIRESIEGRAKPMILLAGKPLIEYIINDIQKIAEIDEIIIITNNKFFNQFNNWLVEYKAERPGKSGTENDKNSRANKDIALIDDGTYLNDDRLGAAGDLIFAINDLDIDDDLLVLAGDNLFKFNLSEIVDFFHKKGTDVTLVYPESSERIKRGACVELDKDGKIIYFEEKPEKPRTNLACPAIYIFTKSTIRLIKKLELDFTERDMIGNIPMMLYKKTLFHALKKDNRIRFDLGTVDDFRSAVEYIKGRSK